MTTVTKVCRTCGWKAKRALRTGIYCVGVRGTHETAAEVAMCPLGHGEMEREDGMIERDGIVVGRSKQP